MQTGVVDSESISQVFREISQRRRQGVLELHYADKRVDIFFLKGKIVDVRIDGGDAVADLALLLRSSGWASASITAKSYAELFSAVAAQALKPITPEIFCRIVRHRILNILYSLDMNAGAYFTFKARMVEVEKEFLPTISVGQLLLDLVAIQSDAARFKEIFTDDQLFGRDVPEEEMLSDEERVIFELLESPRSVQQLRELSLLSTYHFQDALLAMLERGVINTVDRKPSGFDLSQHPIDGESATQPGPCIDQVFSDGSVSGNSKSAQSETGLCDDGELSNEDDQVDQLAIGQEIRLWTNIVSAKLLGAAWLPPLLIVIFLAAAFLAPFLLWGHIFAYFR